MFFLLSPPESKKWLLKRADIYQAVTDIILANIVYILKLDHFLGRCLELKKHKMSGFHCTCVVVETDHKHHFCFVNKKTTLVI